MRYNIRISKSVGVAQLQSPLTLEEALRKVAELRARGESGISLIELETGVEIKDLDAFLREQKR